MSEQEYREEQLELICKIAKRQRVNTVLCIVVLIAIIAACCFAGYRIQETAQQFQESITRIDTASEEIQNFFDGFKAAGYETPEQAIQDLHDTTETINGILNDISENGIFGLGGLGGLSGLGGLGGLGSSGESGSAEEGSSVGENGDSGENGSLGLGESVDDVLNQAKDWLNSLFG